MSDEFNVFSLVFEKHLKDCKCVEEDKKFIKARATGAEKIQKAAAAKGGYAQLTAIHFKAKEIPYKQSLKHVEDTKFVEKKADECIRKLAGWKKMSQKEFQQVMGQLEVYGEVFIDAK